MRSFLIDRWAELLALLVCVVVMALIVSARHQDCDEVCAGAGMVASGRDQGCAVAYFCRDAGVPVLLVRCEPGTVPPVVVVPKREGVTDGE